MIIGMVNERREAIITLAIYGNQKPTIAVKAIIDTGFNGDLILPKATIVQLDLSIQGYQETTLGDGSITQVATYRANIIWDGNVQSIDVCSAKNGILIGMGLLDGYRLELDGIPNGIVKIAPIAEN